MPASRPPVIVVAPDSFKGSLDAPAICAAVARGLRRVWPDAEVRACPMADGGEGTLDAVLSRGGERRVRRVTGAGGRQRAAAYGIVDAPEGTTAIIEVGRDRGHHRPRRHGGRGHGTLDRRRWRAHRRAARRRRAPLHDRARRKQHQRWRRRHARGARIAARRRRGDAVAPTPDGLANLASADAAGLDPRLGQCAITIMSDVNNPLCGGTRRDGDIRAAEGRSCRRDRRRSTRPSRGSPRWRSARSAEARPTARGRARPVGSVSHCSSSEGRSAPAPRWSPI